MKNFPWSSASTHEECVGLAELPFKLGVGVRFSVVTGVGGASVGGGGEFCVFFTLSLIVTAEEERVVVVV